MVQPKSCVTKWLQTCRRFDLLTAKHKEGREGEGKFHRDRKSPKIMIIINLIMIIMIIIMINKGENILLHKFT